jgi:L-iditol 2-dehydrogenase
MKALVFVGPGVMALQDRPEPQPGPGEVVVAVRAAGICGSDVHGYLGTTGRRRPGMVMGHEAAGDVIATGTGVSSVRPGDRVALRSILSCGRCDRCRHGQPNVCTNRIGLGMQFEGAYADQVLVPEALTHALPDNLSYAEGAMIEPLAVALHAVNITPLRLMDTVVVIGAGAIGLLTLLAVRRRGASSIFVSDRSSHRLAVAEALGADHAVNVDHADLVAIVHAATEGRGADTVFEAVGISATVAQSLAVARSGGNVTWIGNSQPVVELPMHDLVTRELTLRGAYTFDDEFAQAADAIASGWIDVRPLIQHTARLEQGPDVFRELGAGTMDAVKVMLMPDGGVIEPA